MKIFVVAFNILPAVLCALKPESAPRPSRRGFSTIEGICDTAIGTIDTKNWQGRDGTLKACTQRCNDLKDCQGFNFLTDQNECRLFKQECQDTQHVARGQPTQNFYLKGEIACSTSTVGKEFWVAFMANRVAQPKNMSLEIWLTQDESETETTVTLESDLSQGLQRSVQIPYKQAVKTLIPFTWKVTDVDNGVRIEKKAIKLSSDTDFVFYGVNKEYFTADAYLGIPSRALGTRYVANCFWPPFYNCEFAFTPTEDNTRVAITLPKRPTTNTGNWAAEPTGVSTCDLPFDGNSYTNGDTFTITVNRFEVAQIQDPCDLTGAIIESDKPIAVWSGDSRVNIGDAPSRDHQVEELFSTDTWGTDCAAWPTPNRTPGLVDYWVITANADDTRITVDSTEHPTENFDLNAGESVRFPAHSVNEYMRFSSDKKFQAAKYASSATDNRIPGDPSMTLCIPTDQFGFHYTFVTPTGVSSPYNNYLSIITTQGAEDGFMLDNQPITLERWTNFPNSNLVGGFIQLDGSRQQFRIEHKVKGTSFEAYIYGAGDRESIAYPTGACIKALGECVPSNMVIADGKDNDCDGVIDEELWDGIDNDFDGQVDEDCYDIRKAPEDRCPTVHTRQSCYNGQLKLNCDDGNTIKVIEAHYGRVGTDSEMTCNSLNVMDSCSGSSVGCGWRDISNTLSIQCDGNSECLAPVSQFHIESACPPCSLYAQVQYVCLNKKEHDHGFLTAGRQAASSWLATTAHGRSCPASNNAYAKFSDKFSPPKSSFASDAVEAWRPADCDKDSSWLQVDLGLQYAVGWYAISGCRRNDYWTTKFGISHSLDGKTWTTINKDGSEAMKLFDGNTDSNTAKVCTLFQYNIVARFVRIHPVEYYGYPCAHVDFGHGSQAKACPVKQVVNSNFARGGSAGFTHEAAVSCNRGWTTSKGETSYTVKCNSDGQWQSDFSGCDKLLHCPDIPQIANGFAVAANNFPGASVTYDCVTGYRLMGTSSIRCQQDGTWSDNPPYCEQL